ncbi:FitA-like ribbon-helix-helix domain-containing protein [Oharaeibacter diazotrophicus]|uniref:Antitoxin FitA-like ribbon-helix-helix domain-containing protein n=2 Tax=Oharaeibacter diazotrophicus TaxID=1920512 RepID=A0A4R6R990_9HYPH|nr:hypothetical protein [Oharaeibacter diazotrophicus]TDP82522.1 hypothetical protein EDD54_3791 [Oharaeibacter diazotrophicus]BBE72714.1 hypothetical protein OHA_1_02312 [Pleomorphomonas sp. SM30]GLS76749.1 hypothetical protein GCM10007904_20860 [Oharaeibacter diazotrophicus]
MTDILIRNVDPNVRARLKSRAAERGTSLSAEINAILADAVLPAQPVSSTGVGTWLAGLAAAADLTALDFAAVETAWATERGAADDRPPPFGDER